MTTADDKTDSAEQHAAVPGFSPEALNVFPELHDAPEPVHQWPLGGYQVAMHRGRDAFWAVIRRPERGGIALRTFPIMGAYDLETVSTNDRGGEWKVSTHSGCYNIVVQATDDGVLRITSRLTPSHDLLVVFWPRDLYVLDPHDDPRPARGQVEAGQRGLNGGFCYFTLEEPDFGNVLYMQNFSAMNDFFNDTKTKPDGVVGGQWPELGYQPPGSPMAFTPPLDPLKKGKTYVISDALVRIHGDARIDEFESARTFVDMLADIYPRLDKPQPVYRDWLWRAEKTLNDLKTSPDACENHFGNKYLRPYVAAEVPDSMVQMTVLHSLRQYEHARGKNDPLSEELLKGMEGFFDPDLRTLRRYLPDVGPDKNRDAVDSWYLYHPLMNLARLAIEGEDWADTLFRKSIAFTINAAQHFKYKWPIQYDLKDLRVIEKDRGDGLGQTDVGGFYAYVMLLGHELTGDNTYLEEARKALKGLEDVRFELVYQTNLTAWGLVACLRLWRLDKDDRYLDQSFVFLAGLMHNCELWSSHIGQADAYANFFGVTCLHDGPYMAAYEAFEVFEAFDEALSYDGLPDSMRLLMSEYRRYALDVLWSFYPDSLPAEGLARKIRNGHIDRALSFPLEDIYGDGSEAGQVGQEVYGAGSAFVVAARAYHDCGDAPFRLFADYFVTVDAQDHEMRLQIKGPRGMDGRIRLIAKQGDAAPSVWIEGVKPQETGPGFVEYRLASDALVTVVWS